MCVMTIFEWENDEKMSQWKRSRVTGRKRRGEKVGERIGESDEEEGYGYHEQTAA